MDRQELAAALHAKLEGDLRKQMETAMGVTPTPIKKVYVDPPKIFSRHALVHKTCGNWVEQMPGVKDFYGCPHCSTILPIEMTEPKEEKQILA